MSNDPTFLWLDSTAWTAITAIATTALVLVGGLTIISAGIDSRAKSRPYVVPELRLAQHAERLRLVITNYGASAARNVRITLPKVFLELEDDKEYEGNTAWAMQLLKQKYAHTLPIIGPGQSESNIWIFRTEVIAQGEDSEDPVIAPATKEKIIISYDRMGWVAKLFRLRYTESFDLDYTVRTLDTVSTSSLDLDQQMKKVIGELGGIKKAISNIN